MENKHNRTPLWFKIVLIILLLPLFSWPSMMSSVLNNAEEQNANTLLVVLFPVYALLSVYLAYRSFDERKELSFIMLGVLILAYICAFLWLI